MVTIKKIFLIFCCLCLIWGCQKSIQQITNSSKLPKAQNILFIAVDDLKPLLNSYGYSHMHTPNFDRLAKIGITFTNAHVQQAVCGPSRASIMTGCYPDRTKVWDLHTDFRQSAPDLMSMPEYLITQGFETTAVGKIYHRGSTAKGHDGKSWSMPHSYPYNYDPAFGKPSCYHYQDPETKAKQQVIIEEAKAKGLTKSGKIIDYTLKKLKPTTEGPNVSDEAYQDGLYVNEAIERMKQLKMGGKPFFLGVGFQKPHLPFNAPKKYWDLYDRDEIDLAVFRGLTEDTPAVAYHDFGELKSYSEIPKAAQAGEELSITKQKEMIHGYMACISYIDALLGKLLNALDEENLTNNTVIVLWSDHGFHLGDHTLWCKHSNFEQATRIPLIFAAPNMAKGLQSNHPVELVDVFPTLFDLVGVQNSNQAQGKSLVPLMDNDPKTKLKKDYAQSQFDRNGEKVMGYSIRTDRYRYTEWYEMDYKNGETATPENIIGRELYDYEKDPNETKNFVGAKSYQKVVVELKSKLGPHSKP